MKPYLLLLIGLLLIFLEFYLPGMIIGSVGAFLIIASVALFAYQTDSPWELLLFLLASGAGVVGIIYLAISRIRSTAKAKTIYLESDQEGYVASEYDHEAIGKTGVVLSDLKPSGHALIAGRQYQVASQSGYITEGTEIVVIGGQGAVLIVKPLKKDTST